MMILKLNKDGNIMIESTTSKREVLMNNHDIQNLVFSRFQIENKYTFNSFFKMFQNYPFLQTLFPIMKDYINEYETIDAKDIDSAIRNNHFLVLTTATTIRNGFISNEILTEVYNSSDVFQEHLNISIMKINDYIDFNIALNTLAIFEADNVIEEEGFENTTPPQIYFEIDVTGTYDFITFVKTLVNSITACGFSSERNKVIEEMNKEKEILKLEADRITAKIMGDLNG